MTDLFLSVVRRQQSGRIHFGGCSKEDKYDPPPPPPPPPPPSGGGGGSGRLRMAGPPAGGEGTVTAYRIAPDKRYFLVILKDRHGEITPIMLSQHLNYLKRLVSEGVLDTAAAFASGERGLQILAVDSREQAISCVQSDPLVQQGYYSNFDLNELLPA